MWVKKNKNLKRDLQLSTTQSKFVSEERSGWHLDTFSHSVGNTRRHFTWYNTWSWMLTSPKVISNKLLFFCVHSSQIFKRPCLVCDFHQQMHLILGPIYTACVQHTRSNVWGYSASGRQEHIPTCTDEKEGKHQQHIRSYFRVSDWTKENVPFFFQNSWCLTDKKKNFSKCMTLWEHHIQTPKTLHERLQ